MHQQPAQAPFGPNNVSSAGHNSFVNGLNVNLPKHTPSRPIRRDGRRLLPMTRG